jgi:hypothetical protein
MLRSYCVRIVCLASACLLEVSCGSDSDTPTPTPEAAEPGGSTAPGGGGSTAMGGGAPSAGVVTPGESMNAGVVNGAGLGDNSGAPAAGATSSAAGGGATSEGTGGAASTPPAGASPFPSAVTRPRIMIVGDSISAGPGCYKKYLLADLNAAGYTNFDFVGEYTDDCGGGVMHSAVSCSTAEQYTQPTFTLPNCFQGTTFPGLSALAAEHQPDLLMIQLGVNDVWNAQAIDTILGNYATLVQQARAQNPNVVIALAQIQQIRPTDGGDAVFARAEQLTSAVPAWAQTQNLPESPLFVADLWTNSDTAQTNDGVHPDDAGAQRMAENWFNALKNILPQD